MKTKWGILVFLLLGCKKTDPTADGSPSTTTASSGTTGTSTTTTTTAACNITDACAVLTKEDIDGALGITVKPGEHGSGDVKSGSITVSGCEFGSAAHGGQRVHVTMRCGRHTDTDMSGVKKTFTGMNYTTITDVTGVGDVAAWGSHTTGGKTSGQLDAYKGSNVYLIVGVHNFGDDASALAAAKKLQGIGLGKL